MDQENNNTAESTANTVSPAPAGNVVLTGNSGLDIVKNILVTLTIELGRTRMSLKDLLALEQGSVIELERMVDEPMDVFVNGTLVAHGEVVVIDDTFGVRLTDVVAGAADKAA